MKNQRQIFVPATSSNDNIPEIVTRVAELADSGNLADALAILNKISGSHPAITNARAVCCMRCGNYGQTLRILRSLVLQPGCMWMKKDLPTVYKTNFSTALLLSQRPVGACNTLAEIGDSGHPSVDRLWRALRTWESHLPWMQWLNWKLSIDPSLPVTIDFAPGDFVEPLEHRLKKTDLAELSVTQSNNHQVA